VSGQGSKILELAEPVIFDRLGSRLGSARRALKNPVLLPH
jgi:hypothetical protein